jgi:N-acetylneuraminate epimerase
MHRIFLVAVAGVLALSTSMSAIAQQWPDFPVPLKLGAGARIGNQIFAGLGTAGKSWFVMDINASEREWKKVAAYPGNQRDNPNAVALGQHIYIFGGQFAPADMPGGLRVDDTVYRYDTKANTWEELPTRAPYGLLATSAATLDNKTIVFVGGVSKVVFDTFFEENVRAGTNAEKKAQIAEAYLGKRAQDYFFMTTVLQFDPANLTWKALAHDPGPVTIGAAVATKGGRVEMVGGELKPGLRSRHARQFSVNAAGQAQWSQEPIGGVPWEQQDGFAGGYAGYSGETLLMAGGATFPGSSALYEKGQMWAHKGLKKTWSDRVYAKTNGKWSVAGKLPEPMGYSPYVQLDDGVLIIGGELQEGKPTARSFAIRMHNNALVIED